MIASILKLFAVTVSIFTFSCYLIGEDEAKNEASKKQKEEIKDIEITGIVAHLHSSEDLPPGSKKKTSWYALEIKGGYLITLPEKIDDKEVDFKLYEGKEVIIKGKAKEKVEKFEGQTTITKDKEGKLIEDKGKVEFVKLPEFVSLKSIQLKSKVTEKEEKSDSKKDNPKKDPGNIPYN